jgi:hypothetical protein
MSDWMPVFLVMPARRANYAEHPNNKGERPARALKEGTDFLQRIGTAVKQDDGSYLIELAALPVSGRLLIKAPSKNDLRDPTQTGGR